MEISAKETENENMRNRLKDEKKEFEVETKERLLRDIQVTQIEIEDKRKEVAIKEADLRKDYAMLEKKKNLLQSDREELERKLGDLEEERSKFEEQHRKLKWTSE
jgi:chromosome segregation ATPase